MLWPLRSGPPAPGSCDSRDVLVARLDEAAATVRQATSFWLITACGLFVFFPGRSERGFLLALVVVSATASALAYGASRRAPWRAGTPSGLRRAEHVLTLLAALVGAMWGVVPIVLFAGSDPDHRLMVVGAVALALATTYRMGSFHAACIAYAAPICIGSLIGFALGGTLVSILLAIATAVGGVCVISHCAELNALSARRFRDRFRIEDMQETIHDLLLDFDEDASDWLWRTDAEGRFELADGAGGAHAFESFAGTAMTSLWSQREGIKSGHGARAVVNAMSARKPFRSQLVEVATADGTQCWRLSGKPIHDAAGRFAGYRGIGSDVTGARNAESRIAHLANNDALTGFANRSSFQAFAERQCAAAATDGRCRALLCLDLDGFKRVNDGFGHAAGDEVLKEVAARLTAAAPPDTFMARLGGDEFALWIKDTTPAKAEDVARHLIEALAVPFAIYDANVEIGTSVGIALTPKHATDAEDLLVKADLALYSAKGAGKGTACIFVETFETTQIARRKLESDLKLALARGEFELHYQPLVDVVEGRVCGFEALIRWNSPERGRVSPTEFIPVAESTGLIVQIGRWALFTACREAARWPDDVYVAVNVSPRQMRSSDFQQDLMMALKTSGLSPTRLEVEVTEGVFLDKAPAALATLKSLRDRGIRIALDDFGTGFSSLNYLIDFPVDKIKIDRSFVNGIEASHNAQAVIDAILGLARRLSIRVVAEGVETKEQALSLKRRRCDTLQGYLFSPPRPAGDIAHVIASVPAIFREAIPTHAESPLAAALMGRKTASA